MSATMVSVGDALSIVLRSPSTEPIGEHEEIPVADANRRVCATSLQARWQLPGHPVSVMDGVAARAEDVRRGSARIVGESAAGQPYLQDVPTGCAVLISTGAIVPIGVDQVTPREELEAMGTSQIATFRADAVDAAQVGRYIRVAGSDLRAGEAVARAGLRLGPGDLALLASAGHAAVEVFRLPKVAIISSGDELVAPGEIPGPGQIVSSNAMMLCAQVREAGGIPIDLGRVPDDENALRAAFEQACDADIIVSSGGISVGDHDLVMPVLESLGFETSFSRVALRPGRPTTFGQLRGRPVFALPGNPASSFVAFELFVRPALRRRGGHEERYWHLPRARGRLLASVEGSKRREVYARARSCDEGIEPLSAQLSGALRSISEQDAMIRIPAGTEIVESGAEVEVIFVRGTP